MQQIQFGKTGLQVSKLCLGTMTFGREADEKAAFAIADAFVERGGTFIDTANIYAKGESERLLGRWMIRRDNRHQLVVATKVYNPMGPGANDRGLSRRHILDSVDDSLTRLGVDYIDLFQIHRWDPLTPVEETVRTLEHLIHTGKVRYVAASNMKGWHLGELFRLADAIVADRIVSIQQAYNAVNRSAELEVLPFCEHHGLAFMAYNPLAGGLLTGKYRSPKDNPQVESPERGGPDGAAGTGKSAPNGRNSPAEGQLAPGSAESASEGQLAPRLQQFEMYRKRYLDDAAAEVAVSFAAAARERGVSPAQLALAWVLADQRVTTPILGARNVEQLTDTMAGLDIQLTPEDRAAIPAALPGRWFGKDPVYDRDPGR